MTYQSDDFFFNEEVHCSKSLSLHVEARATSFLMSILLGIVGLLLSDNLHCLVAS